MPRNGGKSKTVIANCITISRILFSFLLFACPVDKLPFAVIYLLCGVSDGLDGFVARKLHTESKKGAMLDSLADLIFAVVYAIKILPLLSIPLWLWFWTFSIAVIKVMTIIANSAKAQRFWIAHSFGNKLTGFLLFLLPLSLCFLDEKYGVVTVCTFATITAIKEIVNQN